jgi:hypothetical protein
MGYVHSLEIRWTKNTEPGDQMDYAHTAWRSDGLCTHGLEIRWTKHTAWRSDELCTHSLEIPWTKHTRPGDPMD